MRCANALVLLGVMVLTVWATHMTPSYVETFLGTADSLRQRQTLRKACRDTIERLHAVYRKRPVEDWPSERARLTYTNAERILAELGETKP